MFALHKHSLSGKGENLIGGTLPDVGVAHPPSMKCCLQGDDLKCSPTWGKREKRKCYFSPWQQIPQ
jgi:hypothetical protein